MKEATLGDPMHALGHFDRCAIVGNSGAMLEREYGRYIDAHDVVVRINVLENHRYHASLGNKTDFRVLSYKMSKDVCCFMPPEKHTPENDHLTYLIWFPANRKEVADRIRARYSHPVREMLPKHTESLVHVFKIFREEFLRLGFGPFEDWEYLTSGMHAVLTFIRHCKSVDVYGFTTDVHSSGPYWFTGRQKPPRSGKSQHSWDHERLTLRTLAAAGLINVCSG